MATNEGATTVEKKPPQEVARCLKICRTLGSLCTDAHGVTCSYRNPAAKSYKCVLELIGDSADALEAALKQIGGGL